MEAKKASEEDAAHVPLQAIILADSFTTNTKLGPITLECPKVLLPVVNTPMIDYTLAWLESTADVEEVFVLCCLHSKQIINYLDKSKWVNQPKPNFSVTTIESLNCTSVGDALRVISKRNVIQGDFILVSGDTVSNMMLTQALEEHKERKGKDNNAVMTMVIKQSEKPTDDDELIMAIDPTTKELLYYEDKAANDNKSFQTVSVNPCLSLHNDKQDCYIDICSPQVLSLFRDNLDYQHLRRHFVKGLLDDDNLMGFKIFIHEIHSSCYAARIDDFRSYDSISKDIIQRRTYPFVPHVQFSTNNPSNTNITPQVETYIGKDTIIGNNTKISNSVVGDGCKIGSNVAIDGCYVWNNVTDVTIQDGCKLRHAILCDAVVMKSGAVLKPGVVLSFKVVVGQDFVVPRYSKVSLLPQPVKQDGNTNTNSGIITNNNLENGRGFIWSMSEEDKWVTAIPEFGVTQVLNDDLDFDTESDDEIFEKKVEATFLRAVEVKLEVDHIVLEVRAIRSCYGMDREKCAGALFYSMMKLARDTSKNSGNDLVKETNDVVSQWGNLLKPYLKGIHVEIEVILKFEEMCLESVREYAPFFVQVLSVLYDKYIIQEDAILNWAKEKEHADESDKVFFRQSEMFIQRLKEARV